MYVNLNARVFLFFLRIFNISFNRKKQMSTEEGEDQWEDEWGVPKVAPRTWSYHVMGNEHAGDIYYQVIIFINSHLTREQREQERREKKNSLESLFKARYELDPHSEIYSMMGDEHFKEERMIHLKYSQIAISKISDDELVEFILRFQSRLAFQVLGVYLMDKVTEISEKLKVLILENSRWQNDIPYLKEKEHQEARKKYLREFREKIKNYVPDPESHYDRPNFDRSVYLPPINHFYEEIDMPPPPKEREPPPPPPSLDAFLKDLKELIQTPFKGTELISKGALEQNGFKFIFRVYEDVPSSLDNAFFHKVYELRSNKRKAEIRKKHEDNITRMMAMDYSDLELIGSLKTLIPKLLFADEKYEDALFWVWMFVITPDGRQFPADMYYGKGSLSMVGCSEFTEEMLESKKKSFPEPFRELITFSPHDFNEEELQFLIRALETALGGVPISDFQGIYSFESYISLMGIKKGKAFIKPY